MPGHHAHIPAGAAAVGQAAGALDAFCAAERLPDETAWRLRVAIDEIVANIIAHGAAELASGLDIWFSRDGPFVEITVADDGPAFDPLKRAAPDITLPLDARQPGGLGIALVKGLMDEVRYQRTTRNIVTIRKRIDPAPSRGGPGSDEHSSSHS